MGLGVFVHVVHLLIDVVEQCRDKLHRGHAALLSGEGCHTDQHGGVVGRRQAQKRILIVCKGLYIFIVCQRLTPSVSTKTTRKAGAPRSARAGPTSPWKWCTTSS